MRVRVAASLGLTAVTALALSSCSADAGETNSAAPARGGSSAGIAREDVPLSSAALEDRLLDESDLGSGYLLKPQSPEQHHDVTVLGCPALKELGGEAATGGSLDSPRKAEVSFTYTNGSSSELSEELYSDTAEKLSDGTDRIFEAMTGCPEYQVLVGSTAINITTQKTTPPELGDEQWSQLMTFSAGGRDSIVKQIAIRDGSVLLVISGAPALVDRHLDKALTKATEPR